MKYEIVVIGAGPAGLSAAYELASRGEDVLVLEKDSTVGGLSRTVDYKGFRCDIGGHRFFTKNAYVNKLWHEVLGKDFLKRRRLSRIYYDGKFYYYPLRFHNALKNLGLVQSLFVISSLLHSKLFPERPEVTFDRWVKNRFGSRLFEMFFRSYTEKVWGVPCESISSNWAAQRIKNLSLIKAILRTLGVGGNSEITSLIEEFNYPVRGPGQMYQAMAQKAKRNGAEIRLGCSAVSVEHKNGRVCQVRARSRGGCSTLGVRRACLSSMPLDELVLSLSPAAPQRVVYAARRLRYRSLVTVNLLIDRSDICPDNWIYVHSPDVRAARIQFYKNWSPQMVPCDRKSIIGLEYFCNEGDRFWQLSSEQLREIAARDITHLKLTDPSAIFDSFCVKYAKAYPLYDGEYMEHLDTVKRYLQTVANLYPIGRYGQFRYNNMDHSILTAHCSIRAMDGEKVDPWSVNAKQDYHEEESVVPNE